MSGDLDSIIDQAAAWQLASAGDDMDWDAFTRWLEADPRHARAFDELELTADRVEAHRDALMPAALPVAANDEEPIKAPRTRGGWWRWTGGAVAAALAVAMVAPRFMTPDPAVYVTTGQSRTIALEDGSRIELAPRSRLEVAGRQQEQLALAGGAWFDIRHDSDRAMRIRAGDVTISDIGTRFDVQATQGSTRVAVAEGRVAVASAALTSPVVLGKGRALEIDSAARTARLHPLADAQIGTWRSGRLSYSDAPLSLVAADLGRYAGVRVEVPDSLANRQFSGTLVIGDGTAALRDLSRLMDLGLERGAAGYSLSARSH